MQPNDPYSSRPDQQVEQRERPDPYGQGHSRLPKSDKSTVAVILAGLSWVACGPLFSIPALIISMGERKRIRRGEIAPDSGIEAAFWLSVVNLIVMAVSFAIGFIVVFVGAASGVLYESGV